MRLPKNSSRCATAGSGATCAGQHLLDVALRGAVEHGRAEEEAFLELAREGEHFLVVHALEQLHERLVVIVDIDEAALHLLLDGKDATTSSKERGDVFVRYEGLCVGMALAKDGHLKNRLPRWMVQKS